MPRDDILNRLAEDAIVPVVVLHDVADALPLAHALHAGGLRSIELTLRTPAALDALHALATDPILSDMAIGVGTVRTPQQAREAIRLGAQFVVSPGLDIDIVAICFDNAVATLPGVATATEIMRAQRAGLNTVKFFPAEPNGGLPGLSALAAPFYDMMFVPTGGITAAGAGRYLQHTQVLAVGGSWMVPAAHLAAKDWPEITSLAAQCRLIVNESGRKASSP